MTMTRTPSRRPAARSRRFRITLTDLLWALIGLMLTIGGTLLRASMVSPHFVFAGAPWSSPSVPLHFLGVSYQIGAVLLIGCLGGKNAAVMSQIAYLALGLAGFPVFSQGGGIQYLSSPSFGYLLGFVPGAWICGFLAFKAPPRLESLAFSGLCGLFVIHAIGILYLILGSMLQWVKLDTSLWQAFLTYSVNLLPGQIAVTCAIAVLAFVLRRIMFY
jgi:biotin transport system substrate-specific component